MLLGRTGDAPYVCHEDGAAAWDAKIPLPIYLLLPAEGLSCAGVKQGIDLLDLDQRKFGGVPELAFP